MPGNLHYMPVPLGQSRSPRQPVMRSRHCDYPRLSFGTLRGDRHQLADRLDPVDAAVGSRFSRSRSFKRSRSVVVNPGRRPASRSVCRNQLRNVSGVQPIFSAIEQIAAHCELYSSAWSTTMRTARSRTSDEYRFGLPMTPSSQEMESPGNPERFSFNLMRLRRCKR